MPGSRPSQESKLLEMMLVQGRAWVAAQRERYRPVGRKLSGSERVVLETYFSQTTLEVVRIAVAPVIENPPFYANVAADHRASLIDFRQMGGITFADVFTVRQDLVQTGDSWISLVFHEMVHVVQYGLLGVAGFVDEYLRGSAASGFAYARIPLEVMAYDLQAQFQRGAARFDAEAQVRRRLTKVAHQGGA